LLETNIDFALRFKLGQILFILVWKSLSLCFGSLDVLLPFELFDVVVRNLKVVLWILNVLVNGWVEMLDA